MWPPLYSGQFAVCYLAGLCMQESVPAHACVNYCCFVVFLLCAWFLFLALYSIYPYSKILVTCVDHGVILILTLARWIGICA